MLEEQLTKNELLLEIKKLRCELERLQQDKADLEVLLETNIEHSDTIEAQLYSRNIYLAQTAANVRACFNRYLTAEVVADLLENPDGLKLGGQRRKVTILMGDIRGFSLMSEELPPEKVVDVLNIFLSTMTNVIQQYQGTIEGVLGDGIFVIFGAPTGREDDAQRAVACAVAMQIEMENVNQQLEQLDLPKIDLGIGMNTGEVFIGNIGSDLHAKYGAIGSHVNLACRIESYTVGGQILISESTLKEAEEIVQVRGQMQVEPKGVKFPLAVYDVAGIGGNHNLFLSESEEKFYTLTQPIPVLYKILTDNKQVGEVLFSGSLISVSNQGAQIKSDYVVPRLSNIKIYFPTAGTLAEFPQEVYAKVLDMSEDASDGFYIRFTSQNLEAIATLYQMYEHLPASPTLPLLISSGDDCDTSHAPQPTAISPAGSDNKNCSLLKQ